MRTRIIYLSLCLMLLTNIAMAQEEQYGKPSFMDKVFIGGGIGAGFGDFTFINVAPIIGYSITPKLSAGVRLTYQYRTFDYYYTNGKKETFQGNDYGVGFFGRQMLFGPIFLQAEYEYLNYDALSYDGTQSRRIFNSFMAGGGISQPVGGKAFFFLTVLYNFSYDNDNSNNSFSSPYNSPWVVRVGITAGF